MSSAAGGFRCGVCSHIYIYHRNPQKSTLFSPYFCCQTWRSSRNRRSFQSILVEPIQKGRKGVPCNETRHHETGQVFSIISDADYDAYAVAKPTYLQFEILPLSLTKSQHSISPSSLSTSPPFSSYILANSKTQGPYASSIASTTLPSTFFLVPPPPPPSPSCSVNLFPAISTNFLPSATRTFVSIFNPRSNRALTRTSSLNHFSSASDGMGWLIVRSCRRSEFARDSSSDCVCRMAETRDSCMGVLVSRVVMVSFVEESLERCVWSSFCWSSSLVVSGKAPREEGRERDRRRRPSPIRRIEPMALRIRTVTSPRSLIASVERGSFSRRMEGGNRKP